MTRRDTIIFYTIIVIVFVGIVLCFILFHSNEQNSNAGDPNEGKNSMIEILAPYAAILSAAAALISAVTAVYIGTRKTRRDKLDELKVEMMVLFTQNLAREVTADYTQGKFFALLDVDFQSPKYEKLHQCAFDELKYEGRNKIVIIREKWEEAMKMGVHIPM